MSQVSFKNPLPLGLLLLLLSLFSSRSLTSFVVGTYFLSLVSFLFYVQLAVNKPPSPRPTPPLAVRGCGGVRDPWHRSWTDDGRASDHVGQEVVAAVGRADMGQSIIVDGGVIAEELRRRPLSAIDILSCSFFIVVDTIYIGKIKPTLV